MKDKRQAMNNNYDVIIIGGGHAGAEAAHASACLGQKTLLLTTSLDTIGALACSPNLGGPARGNLLREIDAIGGIIAKAADEAALHYRHSGKNSAGWAPFVICDRQNYHQAIKGKLEKTENLYILQDSVTMISSTGLGWEIKTVTKQSFSSKAVVVAAGTFINGFTRLGGKKERAGRKNEPEITGLAKCLERLNFKMGIFRTGTAPTVKIKQSALKSMEVQPFNKKPRTCSFESKGHRTPQVRIYKTHTNAATLKVLDNIKKEKKPKGPRYCPSLTDKVQRFPDKKEHPVFVQPETIFGREWFLNGLSIDVDNEVQQRIVNTVYGLEKARIIRFGYSVSYSYLKQGQLNNVLESKAWPGLFFAGQVTGSNGYEEAAATGLVAGINAALKTMKREKIVFNRQDSFVGVLVDDIVTKKISEPYRILLSRADNYIHLRSDNADIRFLPVAWRLRLISKTRKRAVEQKKEQIENALKGVAEGELEPGVAREVALKNKYKLYLKEKTGLGKKDKDIIIPPGINYLEVGLSKEAIEKLQCFQPASVGEALMLDVPERAVRALALYLQRQDKARIKRKQES